MRVKPAHPVRAGDEVRLRQDGRERVMVVVRVIAERAGAPVPAGQARTPQDRQTARAAGRPDGVHLHRQAHQPGAAARSAAAS